MKSPAPRARRSLAGRWNLAFDPDDGGGAPSGWTHGNLSSAATIVRVPSLWDRRDVSTQGGVGFYSRSFELPSSWRADRVDLVCDGIAYRSDVWVNGSYVGGHEGAYTPLRLEVTSALDPSDAEQLIVVRVVGLSRNAEIDGMAMATSPVSKQAWYYEYGGIWGDIWLERRPIVTVRDLVLVPDLRQGTVGCDLTVDNGSAETRNLGLELNLDDPDGAVVAQADLPITAQPGRSRFHHEFRISQPRAWHPDHPELYYLRASLRHGITDIDTESCRIGIRDFTVENGRFYLNGEAIWLRSVLLQPNYPRTLIAPPDRAMMAREIALMKEGGFNMIRAHLRPAAPGFLDLADELGMLVYAETSIGWIRDSPRLMDHCEREVQEMVERDRNHPSVVIWGLHNENRTAAAATGDRLTRLVRRLDSTRVVLDNSGGTLAIDQDFGWAAHATAVANREVIRRPIADVHVYVGAPVASNVYEWLRSLGTSAPTVDITSEGYGEEEALRAFQAGVTSSPGRGLFVSEVGCAGMADLERVVAGYEGGDTTRDEEEMRSFRDSLREGFAARGLASIFGDVHGLIQATQELHAAGNVRQLEALRSNERCVGYGLTQLNDVAGEFHAGILDHWRNPKLTYHALKRFNSHHSVIMKADSAAVGQGCGARIAMTVVSDVPLSGEETVHIALRFEEETVQKFQQGVPAGTGVAELSDVVFDTPKSGTFTVEAELVRDGEALASATETVIIIPAADRPTPDYAIWAPETVVDPAAGDPADVRPRHPSASSHLAVVPAPSRLSGPMWERLLDLVSTDGATAVIGPLQPDDATPSEALQARGVDLEFALGLGNWIGCYHWIPRSTLFLGLPAGGLAGEAYAGLLPHHVLKELGGTTLAGSMRNTQTRHGAAVMLWYSDIEAVPLGEGLLLFCQYRIFRHQSTSPVAQRMLGNLLCVAGELSHGSTTDVSPL